MSVSIHMFCTLLPVCLFVTFMHMNVFVEGEFNLSEFGWQIAYIAARNYDEGTCKQISI